jgi:hypothetical protein
MKKFKYKPGKIRVSKETKINMIDEIEHRLTMFANENYIEPQLNHLDEDPRYDHIRDAYDLEHEIQGTDYMINLLVHLKQEREKELEHHLKEIYKFSLDLSSKKL